MKPALVTRLAPLLGQAPRLLLPPTWLFWIVLAAVNPAQAQEAAHPDRQDRKTEPGEMAYDSAAVEAAVRRTVQGFKEALRSGDSEAALAFLAPELRVYEAGHGETLKQYGSGHLKADIAYLKDVVSETTWDDVVPGNKLALYLSESHTRGTFRGREVNRQGTETIVLVRSEKGWLIRHIHWSSR